MAQVIAGIIDTRRGDTFGLPLLQKRSISTIRPTAYAECAIALSPKVGESFVPSNVIKKVASINIRVLRLSRGT